MDESLIRCECLDREVHENARVDLWFAEEKACCWIEVYVGTERIFQSLGYARLELAEFEFARIRRNLPSMIESWLERLGSAPRGI